MGELAGASGVAKIHADDRDFAFVVASSSSSSSSAREFRPIFGDPLRQDLMTWVQQGGDRRSHPGSLSEMGELAPALDSPPAALPADPVAPAHAPAGDHPLEPRPSPVSPLAPGGGLQWAGGPPLGVLAVAKEAAHKLSPPSPRPHPTLAARPRPASVGCLVWTPWRGRSRSGTDLRPRKFRMSC